MFSTRKNKIVKQFVELVQSLPERRRIDVIDGILVSLLLILHEII